MKKWCNHCVKMVIAERPFDGSLWVPLLIVYCDFYLSIVVDICNWDANLCRCCSECGKVFELYNFSNDPTFEKDGAGQVLYVSLLSPFSSFWNLLRNLISCFFFLFEKGILLWKRKSIYEYIMSASMICLYAWLHYTSLRLKPFYSFYQLLLYESHDEKHIILYRAAKIMSKLFCFAP